MIKNLKEYIDNNFIFFILAGFGGIAVYLNSIRLGKKFKLTHFIIYVIVSGWFGMTIQDFIPDIISIFGSDIVLGDMRYSITSIAGGMTFIVFDYLETKGITGILDLVKIIIDKLFLIINVIKGGK